MKATARRNVFDVYQFTGDDKSPGWPEGWLTTSAEYAGEVGEKALVVSGEGYAHPASKGDYVARHPRSGEFFTMTPAIFAQLFEVV